MSLDLPACEPGLSYPLFWPCTHPSIHSIHPFIHPYSAFASFGSPKVPPENSGPVRGGGGGAQSGLQAGQCQSQVCALGTWKRLLVTGGESAKSRESGGQFSCRNGDSPGPLRILWTREDTCNRRPRSSVVLTATSFSALFLSHLPNHLPCLSLFRLPPPPPASSLSFLVHHPVPA